MSSAKSSMSFLPFRLPQHLRPHLPGVPVPAALFITLALIAAVPAFADKNDPMIYRFDLTSLHDLDRDDPEQAREAWDTLHLVASLQGIVNRNRPTLFLRFIPEVDDFWFDHLRSEGEWLEGRPVTEIESLEQLLRRFRPQVRGLVLYNEELRATSNLASTIAGVEDRLALRHDPSPGSVYSRVMALDLEWNDVRRLFGEAGPSLEAGAPGRPIRGTDPALPSTGSAKADAYLWAKQRYLDAGRTGDEFLAFYIDSFWLTHPTVASLENLTLANHDFFIANRAFFFDLGVWADEAPADDPGQPPGAGRRALEAILAGMADRAGDGILHIGGFTPWLWKYTSHAPGGSQHGGVETEWEMNRLASQYNAVIDADALGFSGIANASFYQHHPTKEHYPQPERPNKDSLREDGLLDAEGRVAPRVYIMFYQGDYDSAAWLNRFVPKWWRDPARGKVPMNWPFNPNLDRRAPHVLHYARTRRTDNEWFISGNSGAGYLNPGNLSAENRDSGRPDGWEEWVAYNRDYFEKYDLSITGFIIDGDSPGMGARGRDHYRTFSPDGIIGQKMPVQGLHNDTLPFIRMQTDFHQVSAEEAAEQISTALADVRGPHFVPYRTILRSPSWHKETMERVIERTGDDRVRFVDAYTFMSLLRIFEETKYEGPAPSGPFTNTDRIRFTPPDDSEAVWPVELADGPFERSEVEGRSVLKQEQSGQHRFLYFRVGDGFGRSTEWNEGTDLVLHVSVLDTGGGRIGVEYNTTQNAYQPAGDEVELTGTGRWREVSISLPDARFEHNQNGHASFRIVNSGAELVVSNIRVQKK